MVRRTVPGWLSGTVESRQRTSTLGSLACGLLNVPVTVTDRNVMLTNLKTCQPVAAKTPVVRVEPGQAEDQGCAAEELAPVRKDWKRVIGERGEKDHRP